MDPGRTGHPKPGGNDAVVQRRHDDIDPELLHDLQASEQVLLRRPRHDRRGAGRRVGDPVEHGVDVARRECNRAAPQKLPA